MKDYVRKWAQGAIPQMIWLSTVERSGSKGLWDFVY